MSFFSGQTPKNKGPGFGVASGPCPTPSSQGLRFAALTVQTILFPRNGCGSDPRRLSLHFVTRRRLFPPCARLYINSDRCDRRDAPVDNRCNIPGISFLVPTSVETGDGSWTRIMYIFPRTASSVRGTPSKNQWARKVQKMRSVRRDRQRTEAPFNLLIMRRFFPVIKRTGATAVLSL